MSQQYNDIFDDLAARLDVNINPYVKDAIESQKNNTLPILYGPSLKGMKGNWRQKFKELFPDNDNKQLLLEVGCHKGQTLREMATSHPEINFIGIDITFKRVVTTAKRAVQDNLNNVISILGSARQLDEVFNKEELDGAMIFFPDPWCKKKKQARNRLVNDIFFKQLDSRLKPGSFFWFKTDYKPYFNEIVELTNTYKYEKPPNLLGLLKETYETTFERKFRLAGEATYEAVWVKACSTKD